MKSYFCHLEHDGLLHIEGPDSLKFLQGQTTCDTQQVDDSHAVLGVYCTPQGRVVCDFLLCQLGVDHFGLRMRSDIRANSAVIFGKYIIFSKAVLEANRDDWQVVAIWGTDAAQSVRSIFGTAPDEQYGAISGPGFTVVQTDLLGEQFECMLEPDIAVSLAQLFPEQMQQAHESQWQALQIGAGIARIEAPTTEDFVPQILNYDLTGHLNFKKGCYTGQEVVARLHYRGTPKRRTYLAQMPGAIAPAAGTPVFTAGQSQSVGNIVNSVCIDETVSLLVAATIDAAGKGLHVGETGGPSLAMQPLPYSL